MTDLTKKDGISGRVSNLIIEKGLSYAEFIKELKIQHKTFYRYMNNEREWPVEWLIKIADYFRVNLEYLIRGPKLDESGMHVIKKDVYQLERENLAMRDELFLAKEELQKYKVREKQKDVALTTVATAIAKVETMKKSKRRKSS